MIFRNAKNGKIGFDKRNLAIGLTSTSELTATILVTVCLIERVNRELVRD